MTIKLMEILLSTVEALPPFSPSPGVWASFIYTYSGLGNVSNAYYALQDDGNFVMYWPTYLTPLSKSPSKVVTGATDTAGGAASAHGGKLSYTVDYSYSTSGSSFSSTR